MLCEVGVLRDWSTCQAHDALRSLSRWATISCMVSYEFQHHLARWHLGLPFRERRVSHCFRGAQIPCTVSLLPLEDPRAPNAFRVTKAVLHGKCKASLLFAAINAAAYHQPLHFSMCAINLGQGAICKFKAARRCYVISLLSLVNHDSSFRDIATSSEKDTKYC